MHPVADAERRGQRLDFLGDVGVVNDRRRSGVLQNVAQLALGVGRVDWHRLRAGGVRGEHRDRHVEGVGADQCDAGTARAAAGELRGEAGDAAQIFGVGETARAADECGCLRKASTRIGEHMHHGGEHPRQSLGR